MKMLISQRTNDTADASPWVINSSCSSTTAAVWKIDSNNSP